MKKRFKILIALLIATLSVGFAAPATYATGDQSTGEVHLIDEGSANYTQYTPSEDNYDISSGENCDYSFLGLTPWDCGTHYKNAWAEEHIKNTIVVVILNITTDLTILAAYLVLGFVIYGGYRILASAGDVGKVTQGKKTLTHAFVGLAIVMLANVIFNIIRIGILSSPKSGGYTVGGVDVTLPSANATDLVGGMIAWFIGIGGMIAFGLMIYGGITLMTANGDPSKIKMGKNILLYAILGLLIVGLAEVITAFVTAKINEAKKVSLNDETQLVLDIASINEKGA